MFKRHASFFGYLVVLLVLVLLDALAGRQVSLWILFLLPISLATWNLGRQAGYLMTVLTCGLSLTQNLVAGHVHASVEWVALAEGQRYITFAFVAFLVGLLRRKEVERIYISSLKKSVATPA